MSRQFHKIIGAERDFRMWFRETSAKTLAPREIAGNHACGSGFMLNHREPIQELWTDNSFFERSHPSSHVYILNYNVWRGVGERGEEGWGKGGRAVGERGRGVGEGGRDGKNCQIWWWLTIAGPTRYITSLGLNKLHSNKSLHNSCMGSLWLNFEPASRFRCGSPFECVPLMFFFAGACFTSLLSFTVRRCYKC